MTRHWQFWKSEADVEGAKRELVTSSAGLKQARDLDTELLQTGTQLRDLRDSNGFAEAIARLYQAK